MSCVVGGCLLFGVCCALCGVVCWSMCVGCLLRVDCALLLVRCMQFVAGWRCLLVLSLRVCCVLYSVHCCSLYVNVGSLVVGCWALFVLCLLWFVACCGLCFV